MTDPRPIYKALSTQSGTMSSIQWKFEEDGPFANEYVLTKIRKVIAARGRAYLAIVKWKELVSVHLEACGAHFTLDDMTDDDYAMIEKRMIDRNKKLIEKFVQTIEDSAAVGLENYNIVKEVLEKASYEF